MPFTLQNAPCASGHVGALPEQALQPTRSNSLMSTPVPNCTQKEDHDSEIQQKQSSLHTIVLEAVVAFNAAEHTFVLKAAAAERALNAAFRQSTGMFVRTESLVGPLAAALPAGAKVVACLGDKRAAGLLCDAPFASEGHHHRRL